jgi:hypothetical protein
MAVQLLQVGGVGVLIVSLRQSEKIITINARNNEWWEFVKGKQSWQAKKKYLQN